MSNNGHTEGRERVKKCPFGAGGWCEKDNCALWTEVAQSMGGLVKKTGMCSFVATNMILSDINIKLSQQAKKDMPKIVLPGMRQS